MLAAIQRCDSALEPHVERRARAPCKTLSRRRRATTRRGRSGGRSRCACRWGWPRALLRTLGNRARWGALRNWETRARGRRLARRWARAPWARGSGAGAHGGPRASAGGLASSPWAVGCGLAAQRWELTVQVVRLSDGAHWVIEDPVHKTSFGPRAITCEHIYGTLDNGPLMRLRVDKLGEPKPAE